MTESTKEMKKKIESLLKPVNAEITKGNNMVEPIKHTKPMFFTKATAFSFINKKAAII